MIAGTKTYVLDNADRVSGIYGPTSSFQVAYDPYNGFVAAMTCTNTGVVVSNAFDAMDRPTNIVYRKASSVLASFAYLYNNAGMVTQKVAKIGSSTVTNRYTYDDLDRLLTDVISGAATSTASFKYDAVGNRTNAVMNNVTNTYVYSNGCDRLVSWGRTNECKAFYSPAGCATALVYSATNKLWLTWDQQYQLTQVSTSATVVVERNGYDPLGRRVFCGSRTQGGSYETNFFIYAGANLIAEVNSTGRLLRAYCHGPGIDNLLSMTVHTGTTVKTYYYITDHLGSVQAVTDSTGTNVVERYVYDAWGRVLEVRNGAGTKIAETAIGNRFMWQGREYSWKTRLYFFRARWYDPVTGRFISKDPSGIANGLNAYVALDGNPINVRDFTGLASVWINGRKYTVDTPEQFEQAIVTGANGPASIQTFRYRGHGEMGSLWLSEKGTINDGLMFSLMQKHGGLFSDTAKFYLEACNTLNPSMEGARVADEIRRALPNAEIWGFTGLSRARFIVAGAYVPAPRNWYWGMHWRNNQSVPRVSEWTQLPRQD